jgi:hypothetical protein
MDLLRILLEKKLEVVRDYKIKNDGSLCYIKGILTEFSRNRKGLKQ